MLVTPEGGLFESNAIARYVAKLADTALVGHTTYESVSPPLHAQPHQDDAALACHMHGTGPHLRRTPSNKTVTSCMHRA